MALQEYRETGGEKWDYEDSPKYWAEREMEERIIEKEINERIKNEPNI